MIRIFYPSATYPLLRCDSCGAVYAADFQIAFCWVCRLIAIWPAVKNPREDWETNQTSEWQHLKPEAAQRVAYNRAQNAMKAEPCDPWLQPAREQPLFSLYAPRVNCWQIKFSFGPHSFTLLECTDKRQAESSYDAIVSNWRHELTHRGWS